jgi:hypothetical protein
MRRFLRYLRYLRIPFTVACAITCVLLIALWGRSPSVSIPLSSILSTSGQGDLQSTSSGYRMVEGEKVYVVPTGAALQHLTEITKGNGATNVFVVDAPDDISAIGLSSNVFAGYRSANVPVTLSKPDPPRGNHWLVVYLGIAGSGPVRWLVESVFVEKGRIRFNYHRDPSGISTADIHYYYYWVPVGKLNDGVYYLELYDTNLRAITLARRIEVESPRPRKRR